MMTLPEFFIVKLVVDQWLFHVGKVHGHTGKISHQHCGLFKECLHIVLRPGRHCDLRMIHMKIFQEPMHFPVRIKDDLKIVLLNIADQSLILEKCIPVPVIIGFHEFLCFQLVIRG